MKVKFVLVCIVLITAFISCNKSSERNAVSTEPMSLTGRWNLIEVLTDPGDGSGKWHTANSISYYIQFNSDSSFNDNFNNNFIPPSFDPIIIKFSILNDSEVIFIDSSANKYPRHYAITDDTLTITGGCYEACGSKFIK